MKKKQSSVEWLVEQISYQMDIRIENTTIGCDLFEQAKAMHKKEIEDTFECGYSSGYRDNGKDGKQYYNETFGNEEVL